MSTTKTWMVVPMRNKQSISAGDGSRNIVASGNVNYTEVQVVHSELADKEISERTSLIISSRLFPDFDHEGLTLKLGKDLTKGLLVTGSRTTRTFALAWCARLLSTGEHISLAEEYLQKAKENGDLPEIKIAEAYIASQRIGKLEAINILNSIDSYESRSAALMIISRIDGIEKGLNWLDSAGFTASELDLDGKATVLLYQIQTERWDEARESSRLFSKEDVDARPILHHLIAMANLIQAVPVDLRSVLINHSIPFDVLHFPLNSDESGMNVRRIAHQHFKNAALVCERLNLVDSEELNEEYALWLGLLDPESKDEAMNVLQGNLRDPKARFRYIHYAFLFGIELDLVQIESSIEQEMIRQGGMTLDIAKARLSLILTKSTPLEIAESIALYFDQLSGYISIEMLRRQRIEMLVKAGRVSQAGDYLNELVEEGIDTVEIDNLSKLITETQSLDPIELRINKYKEFKDISALILLVEELIEHERWEEAVKYGVILFDNTKSIQHAEHLVKAFGKNHQQEDVIIFIKENSSLLAQSNNLRMMYAWALYYQGHLADSHSELDKVGVDSENILYRALNVNLAIARGDRASLNAHISNEYRNIEGRSAHELMSTAQLAMYLRSEHTKDIVIAAMAKAEDDPVLYISGYHIALSLGWEDDPRTSEWIKKAAIFSGDDGPVKKIGPEDVRTHIPAWGKHESDIWEEVMKGRLPMYLASRFLNRTLASLTVFSALANLNEQDPRRRSLIPTYSGNRTSIQSNSVEKEIGIDATALLTLGYLGVLDKVINSFKTVWIPHSTLGWLFEEEGKMEFHQPSRIKGAHLVRNLLAEGKLERFTPSTNVDDELSAYIGEDLATLIAEAEHGSNDNVDHFVVRSAPVYKLSSFMQEEADLLDHTGVLCSCTAIVEKLRKKGRITSKEGDRAISYLRLHERQWSNQPDIPDGSTLYLDDLSASYLMDLNLLDKIKGAGFTPVISQRTISESGHLISYEEISDEAKSILSNIRASLADGLRDNSVKVGKMQKYEGIDGKNALEKQMHDTFSLSSSCDAIVIDDRFFNRHSDIEIDGEKVTVLSTIDLLDSLANANIISTEDRSEYRNRLYRGGYQFISVDEEELELHLAKANIEDSTLIETSELRAIRESLLCARMSDWLQIPDEAAWLDRMLKSLIRALKNQWKDGVDTNEAAVRSNWLMNQIDPKGWGHRIAPENAEEFVRIGHAAYYLIPLLRSMEVSEGIVNSYWNWLEEVIILPLKEVSPEIYSLLNDQEFMQQHGFGSDCIISFGSHGLEFQRSELFEAIRAVYVQKSPVQVTDIKKSTWTLSMQKAEESTPKLAITHDSQSLTLPNFSALSDDVKDRLHFLDAAASNVNLPGESRNKWHHLLSEGPLEDDQVLLLEKDIDDTPIIVFEKIRDSLSKGEFNPPIFMPSSRRYYERLVGVYENSVTASEYAAKTGRAFLQQLSQWRSYEGLLYSLLLSSHHSLVDEIRVDHIPKETLVKLYSFLEAHGDVLSKLGAVEIGFRIMLDIPEIESSVINMVKQIRDDDPTSPESRFHLFSGLFILTDGYLAKSHLFVNEPPFYRRMAALAQAALIQRQFLWHKVESGNIANSVRKMGFQSFYAQSLIDMRLEPYWNPAFADPPQMQADFFGRLINAGSRYKSHINNSDLQEILFGENDLSLRSRCDQHAFFLPGPLEGTESKPVDMPEEVINGIKESLESENINISSYVGLINSGILFRVDPEYASMAAKALRYSNHIFPGLEDKEQFLATCLGLANVVVSTRSEVLANELVFIVHRYRQRSHHLQLQMSELVPTLLMASAAYENQDQWRQFLGKWITELAFSDMERDEARWLYSCLRELLHIVPELWVTCAKAEAALASICSD